MSPTENQSPAPQPHQPDRPRVVIVGAGFGGLSTARTLARSEVDVLLLDQNNYHGFWPLLYQVATAGLEPESVAYPVRAIFRTASNVRFFMTVVQGVDFADQMVQTDNGPIPYDYLVLAAGSTSSLLWQRQTRPLYLRTKRYRRSRSPAQPHPRLL